MVLILIYQINTGNVSVKYTRIQTLENNIMIMTISWLSVDLRSDFSRYLILYYYDVHNDSTNVALEI